MSRRVGPAAAAFVLALGLAAYPVLGARGWLVPLLALAAPALALYTAALLVPWAEAVGGAIALLALEYVLSLYLGGVSLDTAVPVYAAALFLCAELGWLAAETGDGGALWPSRAFGLLALALAATGLGFAALALAALPLPGGALLTGAGGAAVVAVAAVLAWLARSAQAPPQ
jgi:hypothetical protein